MGIFKKSIFAALIAAACISIVLVPISLYKDTISTERITVVGKEVKDDVYLVYTEEGETFCISDDFISLRFDSSDLYGAIENGGVYDAEVIGFRFKPLSIYRNILSAEEVN